jgi:hypothetical protein
MKKFLLAVLTVSALSVAGLHAEDRAGDQGVGVMLGNPSGLSYKIFMDNHVAIDAAVGADRGEFDVHADLLWHNFDVARNLRANSKFFEQITDAGDLPVFFGAGPRLLFAEDTELGVRFPFGVSFLPHKSPWEFFLELAPVMRFTPDFGFNGDFGIGVRYYFPSIKPRIQ